MGDNNNTVPNLSHLVSSGDSSGSQGEQQTKAQLASERDVVDTFWDIPLITFSEVESLWNVARHLMRLMRRLQPQA